MIWRLIVLVDGSRAYLPLGSRPGTGPFTVGSLRKRALPSLRRLRRSRHQIAALQRDVVERDEALRRVREILAPSFRGTRRRYRE